MGKPVRKIIYFHGAFSTGECFAQIGFPNQKKSLQPNIRILVTIFVGILSEELTIVWYTGQYN
jgi:hypothetical protein